VDSKEYNWAWVTASRLLTDLECELVYVALTANGASSGTILYDGTNTSGDEIVEMRTAGVLFVEFKPPVPIYCRKGLYITKGNALQGILVQWRHL